MDPLGHSVFLLNNEDGTIRFGTFEQTMYNMPINLFKQDPNQALDFSLKFSINLPQIKPLSVRDQLPTRGLDSQGRPQSEQFIPNFDKQFTASEDWKDGDGIDIYVDWARHLPDNSMYSVLLCRVFDYLGQEI